MMSREQATENMPLQASTAIPAVKLGIVDVDVESAYASTSARLKEPDDITTRSSVARLPATDRSPETTSQLDTDHRSAFTPLAGVVGQ